jgi:hypothetical protein
MKILIYGQAKTGTTILYFKIRAAIEKKFPDVDFTYAMEPKDIEVKGETKEFVFFSPKKNAQFADNMLVKALLPNHNKVGFPIHLAKNFDADKKILIVRDPRDRWISSFFYRWYQQSKTQPEEFQKKVRLIQLKEQNPDLLPMFALHSFDIETVQNMISNQRELMEEFIAFKTFAEGNGWHIFKYEDLIDNKFESLSAYLGLDVSEGEVPNQLKRVTRSKAANNWRIWFTDEDVLVFKQIFQDYLTPLGYDADDWKLTKVDKINPQHGSEYMQSLKEMNEASSDKPRSKFLGWLRK